MVKIPLVKRSLAKIPVANGSLAKVAAPENHHAKIWIIKILNCWDIGCSLGLWIGGGGAC